MEDFDEEEIIVPYILDNSLSSFSRHIENAMREIEDFSRVRFVSQNYNNREFLRITSGDGCYFSSYDCYGSRPQTCQPTVSIGIGCRDRRTTLHELLHAIGFQHEHQRPDRDDYVKIYFRNIQQDDKNQFKILAKRKFVWFVSDFEFDLTSVMLYGDEYDFSRNGLPTMERLDGRRLIKRNRLSRMDKEKLESL